MLGKFTVGEHIATHCTRCQLHRNHTIAAMDGERVATVTCSTCGGTSTFTPPAAVPKARASRAKQKAASAQPSVAPRWEAKIGAATGEEHRYTTTAAYSIGDILLHEQFGKGVVLKLSTKKCYVLFQDKERLMASAN